MMLAANTTLYLLALMLAVALTTPVPATAARGAGAARVVLVCGGGLIVSTAIALAFVGLWFESALVGSLAIVVVSVSMWFALARVPVAAETEDEEDDDDGGSLFRPVPPEPTKPEGGPSDDIWTDWSDFDAARAGWERDREPQPAALRRG